MADYNADARMFEIHEEQRRAEQQARKNAEAQKNILEATRASLLTALIEGDHRETTNILVRKYPEKVGSLMQLLIHVQRLSEALEAVDQLRDELSEINSTSEIKAIIDFAKTQAGIENEDVFDDYRQYLADADSVVRDTISALYSTIPETE